MAALHGEHPLIEAWQEGETFHLDVRRMLEEGGEPYPYIMDALQQLAVPGKLAVHALFEPKPLLNTVQRMGYRFTCRREAMEHWVVEIEPVG